jgi:hypothetical protein
VKRLRATCKNLDRTILAAPFLSCAAYRKSMLRVATARGWLMTEETYNFMRHMRLSRDDGRVNGSQQLRDLNAKYSVLALIAPGKRFDELTLKQQTTVERVCFDWTGHEGWKH